MRLIARTDVEVGSTKWDVEIVEGLGDYGDCDPLSRTLRVELGSKEETLAVLYHEVLHAVDCIYKLGLSETKVRILEQEFPRFLAAAKRLGLI